MFLLFLIKAGFSQLIEELLRINCFNQSYIIQLTVFYCPLVFLAEPLPQIALEEPPKLCHVQPGNVLGQCVRLSQCTKAVHSLFTDGEKPTECSTSSEGEVSTICCPESDLSSSTQERHRIDEKSSKPRKINFLMPRSEPLAEESGKRPCEIGIYVFHSNRLILF